MDELSAAGVAQVSPVVIPETDIHTVKIYTVKVVKHMNKQ